MPAEGTWFWVEGMIDVFFYIDLLLNFFVAYEVGCCVRGQKLCVCAAHIAAGRLRPFLGLQGAHTRTYTIRTRTP